MTILEKLNDMETEEQLLYEPFSRKQWIEQRKEDRETAFRMADDAAERCATDGRELVAVLDTMARFPQYSAGNILLIHAQMPTATMVRDYKAWKDIGAIIKKDEKGINIFEVAGEYVRKDGSIGTRYNLKKVFDVSQMANMRQKNTDIVKEPAMLLEALISNSPCDVKMDRKKDTGYLKAEYDDSRREISISMTGTPEDMFRETASAIVMAVLAREKSEDFRENSWRFASQCGSYVLCKRYGIAFDEKSLGALPEDFTRFGSSEVKEFLGQVRYVSALLSQGIEKELLKDLSKEEREKETV
ncbi:MAG: ArdC-like ssDNA-binding domain-containing protein [Oscillospiraceae bacterium]|nr:ArdC-like ssDNA-binding domain-containing protein [Oscillospiraceae bacterium]